MPTALHAIYENGVFRPMQPVDLPERCEVEVDIRTVNRRSPHANLDDGSASSHEREIENDPGDDLQAVWESCNTPDWDGYGALAVSQDALLNGRRFLESLPPDLPAPSIGVEPDGALTMEWHCSERRTLSVSVSTGEELHFAGLFGSNRVYGTETFLGQIPKPILDLVRRVYVA
jgi:predicted DNA-binding antitoxin AbrB/MazE fold protein